MPFWSRSPPATPSISVDLTFTTVEGQTPPPNAQLEIVVFKASHGLDEYTYRYALAGEVASTSCCTDVPDLQGRTDVCPTDHSLYIDPTLASDIERWVVRFDQGSSAHVVKQHIIGVTGEHFLIIADCSAPSMHAFGEKGVVVNGHTEWLNPYGHLMGRLYGYLPFYAIMTFIFSAASLLWLGYNVAYRASLASVQHCISVVLALCWVESFMWFLDYWMWNDSGMRNVTLIVVGILLTVSRLSVSRMLVVAVSLGWGVVRPSLGKNKWRLIALGALYFCCETGLELIQRYSQIDASVEKWRIGLIIPVSVLNSIFYWYTSQSHTHTHTHIHTQAPTHTYSPWPPVSLPLCQVDVPVAAPAAGVPGRAQAGGEAAHLPSADGGADGVADPRSHVRGVPDLLHHQPAADDQMVCSCTAPTIAAQAPPTQRSAGRTRAHLSALRVDVVVVCVCDVGPTCGCWTRAFPS